MTSDASSMTVELVDHMGDDLSIVNAARVSLNKRSEWVLSCPVHRAPIEDCTHPGTNQGVNLLRNPDVGLIGYLMRNKHGTPFEMVQFAFRVRVPIFVAREWQRHRIGSFNEVSSRYVEMVQEAYMPPLEDFRTQVGSPGRYTFESLSHDDAAYARVTMDAAYKNAYWSYRELLQLGLAKEVARNVLPLAQYTEFMWSVNLRSLFNFLSLRMAPTALKEIQLCALQVHDLATTIAPEAFKAWHANNQVNP